MMALILACGMVSRLKNYIDQRPKCLAEVDVIALLDYS
jgi:choline kinase